MRSKSRRVLGLIAFGVLVASCGSTDPAQLADATAEGVAGPDATLASQADDGETTGGATSAPPTTSGEAPAATIAEPEVTVPSDPVPTVPPPPALERVEPLVVSVDFEGQSLARVTADVVPGAGVIEQFGDSDVYTFEAAKGQAFVLEQLGGCSFDGDDDFMSVDIDGAGNNRGTVFLDGDCNDVVWFDAETSDTITVTVDKTANDAVGTYSFRIVDVTDPEPIALVSGDVILPDHPRGAGWIEGFGHRDLYTFEATKDRPFVIRQLGGCAFDGNDDFVAADVRGAGLNSGAIFLDGDCDSIKRFEPDVTGKVEIVVENNAYDVFGFYSFQIYEPVTDGQDADEILDRLGASERADGTVVSLDETVLFDFGLSALRRDADEVLVQVAEVLRFVGRGTILVVGHTDSVGDADDNQQLSRERADAVVARLVELGVAPDALVAEGRGESQPIADNVTADGGDNPEGRAMNRRVEVVFSR